MPQTVLCTVLILFKNIEISLSLYAREYYFAQDTLYMSSLLLVTISSDLHVLVQSFACFILFTTSKQNGLNKNSFPLKCCCRDSAL